MRFFRLLRNKLMFFCKQEMEEQFNIFWGKKRGLIYAEFDFGFTSYWEML